MIVLSFFNERTRLGWRSVEKAFVKTARGGAPLVAAAASVGIILGVVTLTGVGTKFPSTILMLAGENLLLALSLIMVGSIVLGMGLPSAVCYLLMATLIGPIIGKLGVVPLAAHFFIFYFGMMSMVTPPVALAAYTAASIADCHIMSSALAAFRFALVGFTLPFMFVFRPELLLLSADGSDVGFLRPFLASAIVITGIVPLAAAIAGYFGGALSAAMRAVLIVAAALLFYPGRDASFAGVGLSVANAAGFVLLVIVIVRQFGRKETVP